MVFRVSIALVAVLVLLAGIAPGPFNDVVQAALAEAVRRTSVYARVARASRSSTTTACAPR